MHDDRPIQRDPPRSGQADAPPYRASARRRLDDYRPPSLLTHLLKRPRALLAFLVRDAPVLFVKSLRVQGRSDDPAAAGACLERFELRHRPSGIAIVVAVVAVVAGALAAVGLFDPKSPIAGVIVAVLTSAAFGYGGFLMHARTPRWVELHERALVFERRRHVECVPWAEVSMVDYVPDGEGDDVLVVRIRGRLSVGFRATPDGIRAARAIATRLEKRAMPPEAARGPTQW